MIVIKDNEVVISDSVDYGLTQNFELDSIELNDLIGYIMNWINKTIFLFNGNYYDIRSLNTLVNLSICTRCLDEFGYGCCDGSPYAPSVEQIDNIHYNILSILETYPNEQKNEIASIISKQGILDNETGLVSENKKGECLFAYYDEGKTTCGIHKWALENNLNVYDYKPLACSMFPIDCIKLNDNSLFVFGLDKEITFSKWEYEDRPCMLEHSEEEHKDVLYLNKRNPLYIEQKDILVHLFGQEAYDFIDSMSKELYKR